MKKNRIESVDALRGFAVLGILIVHSILHFNNTYDDYRYTIPLIDDVIDVFSVVFISGKAQTIFALLFGFSFYIQNENQRKKNNDFTFRFMWRMVILFFIGLFNSCFMVGEVLIQFSIWGLLLPFLSKLNTKVLCIIAGFMLIVPFNAILFILELNGLAPDLSTLPSYSIVSETLKEGNFFETTIMNLRYGTVNTFFGLLKSGYSYSCIALFICGLILGRKKFFLFSNEKKNLWIKLAVSLTVFCTIAFLLQIYIKYNYSEQMAKIIRVYYNLSYSFATVCVVLLLFNLSKFSNKILSYLIPYGRMSLTMYVSQSIIGAFLFYNWGLGIGKYLGQTYCLLLAIVIFLIQYVFCITWFKNHNQGPLESIWKRLTWIKGIRTTVKRESLN